MAGVPYGLRAVDTLPTTAHGCKLAKKRACRQQSCPQLLSPRASPCFLIPNYLFPSLVTVRLQPNRFICRQGSLFHRPRLDNRALLFRVLHPGFSAHVRTTKRIVAGRFLTSSPVSWGRNEVGVERGSAGCLSFAALPRCDLFAMRARLSKAAKRGEKMAAAAARLVRGCSGQRRFSQRFRTAWTPTPALPQNNWWRESRQRRLL